MSLEEIEQHLRRDAFQNQITSHFQPIVDRNNRLCAFEVLARWFHPEHGLIPSPDFIAVAEQSGSIVALGTWMLMESCRACHTWNQGCDSVGISVNLSAVQLDQENLPEVVSRALQASGLAPGLLTLELTETTLVRDLEFAGHQLSRLRDLGVRIALDDFGAGYSSLAYLASLPVDIVKLDRQFIRSESARSWLVVGSIIELAHKLGMSVVAEGVETDAQARRLLGLGCDELQGRYFGPPRPLDHVLNLMERTRTAKG